MSSQNVVTPLQLLEQFKETYPELNSVQKIVSFGDANTPQAREEQFVRKYGPDLAGGDREARQLYRTALNLSERAVLLWANLRDAVSPHFQQTLFNNLPKELPQTFIDQQAATPGYNRLFGNLDFIECEHHRSIFGPAAYFVDLMRFVQQNITDKNSIPSHNSLQGRRPDLAQIPLDASQTSDLIPSIDLVSELLEAFVATAEGDRDTYDSIRDEIFPMALPFDLPLTEIRTYLKQLKTSLQQVYQTFSRADVQAAPLRRLLTQEALGLSPQEFSLIVSEISQPAELTRLYGGVALTGPDGLENVDVFLAQTGLTHKQLNALLTQDLDRHEVNAGLPRLFFINNVDDGLGDLTIAADGTDGGSPPQETLLNLSPQKLDRIHRFLRLWRKLGWSITELDHTLRSLTTPYAAEAALQFDGINDQVVISGLTQLDGPALTVEAWISPSRPGPATLLSKGDRTQQQVHFALGLNAANQLTFYGRQTSGNPFQRQGTYVLPVDEFTHVAVAVTGEGVQLYVNGTLDEKATLGQAIAPVGADLTIGRSFGDEGFAGVIKDVRLWNVARAQTEIANHRYRRVAAQDPLVGYWPLTPTIDNQLADLSERGRLGQLGGEGLVTQPRWVQRDLILDPLPHARPAPTDTPQNQFPSLVEATRPAPAPPLEMVESVLQLDGENDALMVTNQRNWGLGRFDRWTVEFWFNAANTPDPGRKQVLFTQGDLEAGLSIYLVNNQLQVLEWCNPFGQDDFRSSLMTADDVSRGAWHHIAVVHDEFPAAPAQDPPQSPQVQAVLDGTALSPNPHTAFRMSPVGAICLGGLAQGRVTRFIEAYTAPEQDDRHYFTGQMAEFRLWRKARSPEEIRDRTTAPDITPDLLAYLPLEAPQSGVLQDLAGYQHENPFVGRLLARQMALQTRHTDAHLKAIYAHYGDADALSWQNYSYTGRMRIAATPQVSHDDDAIGVTVLSQYPSEINQYYRLSRDADHPSFQLTAHPEGIQTLKSASADRDTTVSDIQPQVNQWYHFWIQVEDTGTRTLIQAKLWPEGEREPTEFQLQAYDDHPELRLTAGTIGLWGIGSSTQHRQFDNLRVWPLAIDSPTQDDLWLDSNFEGQSGLSNLDHWQDRGDRITPLPTGDRLFRLLEVAGSDLPSGYRAFGTDSTLTNIHAHYRPNTEVLDWQNYTYSGQLRITDGAGGVGVTVLSQHPEYSGPAHSHQYYSLRRDADRPTFHLSAHPVGVQPLLSLSQAANQLDSGVEPRPNTWYRFAIQIAIAETRTVIKAKVWQAGTPEPDGFQVEAEDQSSLRLQSGTVGVWATGAGSKYFDQMIISRGVLLTENFDAYAAGATPSGWFGTGEENSRRGDNTLFKTVKLGNTVAFGTETNAEDIHAHYGGPGALQWRNYSYQGRLYFTGGNIGVTFLSRYPAADGHNYYYRLRANPGAKQREYKTFR
ncbi:MAG: LamG-like jellyroll fold domain-containing protein, partial [Elainellaceae cyanobacterium]